MRFLLSLLLALASLVYSLSANDRPNVILIMTDDQGIGDLGVMGNPVIDTPNIDRLAKQSASLTNFYVHPVCAPTRACLMTGRYNYRTRVVDTYIGRAMMEPSEITIAEVLKSNGYRTGIFGKWHLGDCYPLRAMDQGFDMTLVHRGGGIGQPSDPLEARSKYTDPILFRNGVAEQCKGYCTDVYYDNALKFIESSNESDEPFFVYLPDNTPHGPFHDVPQDLFEKYLEKKIDRDSFESSSSEPAKGHPFESLNPDFLSRVFAMITNVDRNVGRVMNKLEELDLDDNTIVIFMCDNGPNSKRYVKGYRGHKSSVYEGGIRSPFFIRWPKQFAAGYESGTVSAHIDVMPTILSCCNIDQPDGMKIDGADMSAALRAEAAEGPDRNIFIQSHRGNEPVRYHHMAVRNNRWKLVHPTGFGKQAFDGKPNFELYDLGNDPFEEVDIAESNPEKVKELTASYDKWFDDVSTTRKENFQPPTIIIDGAKENPVTLTRQDWRRTADKSWGKNGHWIVNSADSAVVNIRCQLLDNRPFSHIQLSISGQEDLAIKTDVSGMVAALNGLILPAGTFQLSASVDYQTGPEGVFQIEITSVLD